jgi:hypothetical protein
MNIANRMRELLTEIKSGKHESFNGNTIPDVEPECEDDWSEDYAIIQNVYWIFDLSPEVEQYFDGPQFRYDFEMYLKSFFEIPGGEPVLLIRFHEKTQKTIDVPTIVIDFRDGAQEVEVYRQLPKA